MTNRWQRIAAGDYETRDGRYRAYRIPGLHPPAWNVEAVWTDEERRNSVDVAVIAAGSELVVEGVASLRDAKTLFEDEIVAYEWRRATATPKDPPPGGGMCPPCADNVHSGNRNQGGPKWQD